MQYNSEPLCFTSPTLLPCNFRQGAHHLGNNDSQMSLTLSLFSIKTLTFWRQWKRKFFLQLQCLHQTLIEHQKKIDSIKFHQTLNMLSLSFKCIFQHVFEKNALHLQNKIKKKNFDFFQKNYFFWKFILRANFQPKYLSWLEKIDRKKFLTP